MATTAGDGTATIAATSTDVAGTLTFANTWADGDTLVLTFITAYGTAPKVLISSSAVINASGVCLIEIDTKASTTTTFTLTASGTCAGSIDYFVIETI